MPLFVLKSLPHFKQINLLFSTVTCFEVVTEVSLLDRGTSDACVGVVCLLTGLRSSVLLSSDLERTATAGLSVVVVGELDTAAAAP